MAEELLETKKTPVALAVNLTGSTLPAVRSAADSQALALKLVSNLPPALSTAFDRHHINSEPDKVMIIETAIDSLVRTQRQKMRKAKPEKKGKHKAALRDLKRAMDGITEVDQASLREGASAAETEPSHPRQDAALAAWKKVEELGGQKCLSIIFHQMERYGASPVVIRDAELDHRSMGCHSRGEALALYKKMVNKTAARDPEDLEPEAHNEAWGRLKDLLASRNEFKWLVNSEITSGAFLQVFFATGENTERTLDLLEYLERERNSERPKGVRLTDLVRKTAEILEEQQCEPMLAAEQAVALAHRRQVNLAREVSYEEQSTREAKASREALDIRGGWVSEDEGPCQNDI